MIFEIDNKILSEDLFCQFFACDISRCKGACCVEGDEGAPLLEEETHLLEREFESLQPFLDRASREFLEKEGRWVQGGDGKPCTPLVHNGPCAYALVSPDGRARCGIEVAWQNGATSLRKPLSCHLYPLRITKSGDFDLLNYHRWDICSSACENGCSLEMPLFRFLKEALVRAYGSSFYEALEATYVYYCQNKEIPSP